MSLAALERLLTVEEFFREIPDGVKADLIDGGIYVSSPDSAESKYDRSGDDGLDRHTGHIRQPEVPTIEPVRQLLVIQPQQRQDRRVQIID